MACIAASAISSLGTTMLLWHRLSVAAKQGSIPLTKEDCHVIIKQHCHVEDLASWDVGGADPRSVPLPRLAYRDL